LAHNTTVLLIGRKIMMHEEERQGKEVYNWKKTASSSELWYLSTLCHITPKKTVVSIFTTVRTWVFM
jgi:hypothetical protein